MPPLVQTILFQRSTVEGQGQDQSFTNPVQVMLGDKFPVSFDLVILSAVHGAARGMLACTHSLEVDGAEIFKYDHAAAPVPYENSGLSFRLVLEDLKVAHPCTLVIKTLLSNGLRGVDVPLRVADHQGLKGAGLKLQG